MNWLIDILSQPSTIQSIIVISVVAAIGLELGKFKIFNISLGITFVFFIGILVGHLHLNVNKDMLQFAQNFGLILFVYALGLQVGPGFFSSLKKGGIRLNMLSMLVIFLGITLTILFSYTTGISITNMIGILTGAVTNTPALGAAQEALLQVSKDNTQTASDMAIACAIAYPLGVVGVILAAALLNTMFGPKSDPNAPKEKKDLNTYVGEFLVTNPALFDKSIRDIMQLTPKKFVISRIWRDGKVTVPTSESILHQNDHLLIISIKSDVKTIEILFGKQENTDWNKENIDWNHIDKSQLVSRRIIVTNKKVNGVKLGTLRLRNTYEINITRVNRAGIELLPSPTLSLQIGDKLTIVGETNSINKVAEILGNEIKRLNEPNLIAIFIGIALGLLLGTLPIPFPGLSIPVKLGIAAGPIIVGILMGAFGSRVHITTYTTPSANLMMRQLGIVIYLACMGIGAGEHFFETIARPEGLLWVAIGFAITVIPVLLVGAIATKMLKINYGKSVGMLCGSMANPMALAYVNTIVEEDDPAVAYATVYPVSMFIRIISTQILLLMLL